MALALCTNQGSWGSSSSTTINVTNLALFTASKVLVLFLLNATTTQRQDSAPTYAGVSMTRAGTAQPGEAECNAELWYLIDPASGTNTLSIPNSGALTIYYYYISLYTTSAATQHGTPQQSGTSATSVSLTVTAVPAGGAVVGVCGGGYKDPPTARTHTSLAELDVGAWTANCQYGLIGSLSDVSVGWTFASSDDIAAVVTAFKEGVAAATFSASETGVRCIDLPSASVTAQPSLSVPVSETVAVLESASAKFSLDINVADLVESVDTPSASASAQSTLAPSVYERIAVLEVPSVGVTTDVSDLTLSVSDTIRAEEDVDGSVVEGSPDLHISVAEVAIVTPGEIPVYDSTFYYDTDASYDYLDLAYARIGLEALASETVAAIDTPSASVSSLSITVSENVAVLDSPSATTSFDASTSDQIGVADTSSASVSAPPVFVSENVAVLDLPAASVAAQSSLTPSVSETVAVLDYPSAVLSADLDANVSDRIQIQDTPAASVAAQPDLSASTFDRLVVLESPSARISAEVSVADTIGASDTPAASVSALPSLSISVAEDSRISEAVGAGQEGYVGINVADTVAVRDAASDLPPDLSVQATEVVTAVIGKIPKYDDIYYYDTDATYDYMDVVDVKIDVNATALDAVNILEALQAYAGVIGIGTPADAVVFRDVPIAAVSTQPSINISTPVETVGVLETPSVAVSSVLDLSVSLPVDKVAVKDVPSASVSTQPALNISAPQDTVRVIDLPEASVEIQSVLQINAFDRVRSSDLPEVRASEPVINVSDTISVLDQSATVVEDLQISVQDKASVLDVASLVSILGISVSDAVKLLSEYPSASIPGQSVLEASTLDRIDVQDGPVSFLGELTGTSTADSCAVRDFAAAAVGLASDLSINVYDELRAEELQTWVRLAHNLAAMDSVNLAEAVDASVLASPSLEIGVDEAVGVKDTPHTGSLAGRREYHNIFSLDPLGVKQIIISDSSGLVPLGVKQAIVDNTHRW